MKATILTMCLAVICGKASALPIGFSTTLVAGATIEYAPPLQNVFERITLRAEVSGDDYPPFLEIHSWKYLDRNRLIWESPPQIIDEWAVYDDDKWIGTMDIGGGASMGIILSPRGSLVTPFGPRGPHDWGLSFQPFTLPDSAEPIIVGPFTPTAQRISGYFFGGAPEPASWMLIGLAMCGLACRRRKLR